MSSHAQLQAAFEQGVWYRMSVWPDLCTAIKENWGGPQTADKRDWFVGAIVELFENLDADAMPTAEDMQLDVEDRLLQIMTDEFDVNVEDDTDVEVARDVVRCWTRVLLNGDVRIVDEFKTRWERMGSRVPKVNVVETEPEEVSDEDGDEDGDDEDVEMGDAPQAPSAAPRQREEPIVDEDGFTTVVSKKRR